MYAIQSNGLPSRTVEFETDALYKAVFWSTADGRDRTIYDLEKVDDSKIWFVEADTKVDDDDPSFPVIVHKRSSS